MIVSPFGEIIANGEKEEDAVVSAVLNLDHVDEARIAVPTLRDLRNDFWMKYYSRPQYDELL
jgi:predicted amidohydrolase